MAGALLVVPAGSLDSPLKLRPDAHIGMKFKADWDAEFETLPCLESFPE
jgi:hypothetical protein